MSLHADGHRRRNNDHPLMCFVAVAALLLLTCAAIFYMGNTFRVAPTHITRQPLSTPL